MDRNQNRQVTLNFSTAQLGPSLTNKSGLVIGAASGIGRAAACLFAGAGAGLMLADVNEGGLLELTQHLKSGGHVAHSVTTDVTVREDLMKAADASIEAFGRIDFLCYVAGIYPVCAIEAMTEEFWHRVVDINLTGAFFAVQSTLGIMRRQHYGRIAVVSSVTGPKVAMPGLSAYAAAKAGLGGFVRAVAIECGPDNITINAVLPGAVETDALLRELETAASMQAIKDTCPLRRVGNSEDIAQALLFLVSDQSSYMTGQELIIDGGSSLRE
jgi:3-oxoacyl-[acyl-carrier protein] reductase